MPMRAKNKKPRGLLSLKIVAPRLLFFVCASCIVNRATNFQPSLASKTACAEAPSSTGGPAVVEESATPVKPSDSDSFESVVPVEQTDRTLPSIAFLFMTTNHNFNQKFWEQWFPPKDDRYSIFVHTKPSNTTLPLDPFFCKHAIPSVKTSWCGRLHDGMMQLLQHAFERDEMATTFVFVSETSIPLVSFEEMYKTLMKDGRKSRMCWSRPNSAKRRWALTAKKIGMDLNLARKAEMWSTLSRRHVEILLSQRSTLYKWNKVFDNSQGGCPDELFIPTMLNRNVHPSEFQNCTGDGFGLNKCCPTAVFWGENITDRAPVSLLSDHYKLKFKSGSPVHFLSLFEKGLKVLQDQGFLFLRKVEPGTVVRSMSNETLEISDAFFQLHNRESMVLKSASLRHNRTEPYFRCHAPH